MFKAGHSNQPMAPIIACRDTDQDSATFSAGGQSHVRRIPVLITAANGDLLLFCELRTGSQDYQSQGIGVSRSTDNGETYGPVKVVYVRSDYASDSKWISLGTGVPNATGRILLHLANSDGARPNQVMTLWQLFSDDDGLTWGGTVAGDGTPVQITTGLKKVNSTTPAGLPACFDSSNAPWGWCMPGPHAGFRLASGRLVLPYNHRYSTDQATTPWSHCILSDDGGATWFLGGGFQESGGQNDGTNELALDVLPSGDIYANCRIISGGNGNRRGQAIIPLASLGTTWPNYSVMTDGTNPITSNSTQGSVRVVSNGDVLVTCPNDDSVRARLTVFRSTNGGVTFPQKNVLNHGYAGYSHLFETTAGKYGCVFEATDDYANAGATDGMSSNQFIRQVRFDQTFITTPTPAVADFHLNDGIVGQATYVDGTEIGVWGGYCPPGKGGAGATWHADGVSFSGSGAGIQLQELQAGNLGGMCDPGLGDITYEITITVPSMVGTGTIFDNRNNAGRGITFTIDGDNLVSCTIHDNVTALTATQTVPFAAPGGGTYEHTYHVIYQRGVGLTLKYQGPNDPLATLAFAADTLSASLHVVGSQPFRVGSRGGGAVPLEAGTVVHRFRVTRKALADSELLSYSAVKVSPAVQSGYNPSPVGTLPSLTGLKLALFCPQLGRAEGYGSADRFGGISWPERPVERGTYVGSYKDHSSLGRTFRTYTASAFRSPRWDRDAAFGDHVQFSNGGTELTIGWIGRTAVSSDYDYFQNTGLGTIMLAVNFVSNQFTLDQAIIDNCLLTGSNPGIALKRATGTNLAQLQISRGDGNNRINDAFTGALADNTWYFLAYVCQGPSAKVKQYKGQYTAGVLGAISSQDSTSNMDASDGTYASTNPLSIGARIDARGCNARIGPVLFFDYAMTQAQVEAWAAVMNAAPIVPRSRSGNSERNRLATGYRDRPSRELLGR
jgi:sialidase-1